MSSCCTNTYNFCITRGTTFSLSVGLSSAYVEVIEAPSNYRMDLVFREDQDDSLTPYLTLSAIPEVVVDPLPDQAPVMAHFTAEPAETQALPDFNIVAYCQLIFVGPTVGSSPEVRLFNSKVTIND